MENQSSCEHLTSRTWYIEFPLLLTCYVVLSAQLHRIDSLFPLKKSHLTFNLVATI